MTAPAAPMPTTPHALYLRRRRRELRLGLLALILLAGAWLYGYLHRGSDIALLVKNVLPGTEHIIEENDIFIAYGAENGTLLGYAAVGQAVGYGGPVRMLVGMTPDGLIAGVQVVQQRETPGFFDWLRDARFFDQFLGQDSLKVSELGAGVDAVTGATLSSEAVAQGIRNAIHTLTTTQSSAMRVEFGWPEVALVALFASGFLTSRSRNMHWKRWLRLATMAAGIVVIGFVLNKPLTLAHFTSFLSGYWPDWHTNLYWYLLLGGVVLATLARGRNPYCSWFCPFGAVQECLGAIGGAKAYRPQPLYGRLKWLQRGLAFTALFLGLALRQPAATSYEPFGTLFSLAGGFFPWMLLVIILFASLIIQRPFCAYLCPIDPIIELIGRLRGWLLERWPPKRALRAAKPHNNS